MAIRSRLNINFAHQFTLVKLTIAIAIGKSLISLNNILIAVKLCFA